MKAIINATLVMTDHLIPRATVVIDNGRIADFGRKINTDGMEIIDAKEAYLGPGLIDIHTHSDGETFFTEDPVKVANTLLSHGVTDVLAALYFNADGETLIRQVNQLKEAASQTKNLRGLYMEAPYMNPKFGGNRENKLTALDLYHINIVFNEAIDC